MATCTLRSVVAFRVGISAWILQRFSSIWSPCQITNEQKSMANLRCARESWGPNLLRGGSALIDYSHCLMWHSRWPHASLSSFKPRIASSIDDPCNDPLLARGLLLDLSSLSLILPKNHRQAKHQRLKPASRTKNASFCRMGTIGRSCA